MLVHVAAYAGFSLQEYRLMKINWKIKLSLFIYKYVTGPLTAGIVNLFQCLFVWLDKVTGNEVSPISDEEALQEYRDHTRLTKDDVPDEFKDLIPLAIKWGIGDDAIRGDVVEAATESDKLELESALSGKLAAIDKWIQSFPEDSMTDEAAAFMYLAEAVEELEMDIEYGQSR